MYRPFKYWANFNGGYMTHKTDKELDGTLDMVDTCIASACALILILSGIVGLIS